MSDWASQELATLDVGDARRTVRAQQVVSAMAELPAGSIPQVFRTPAEIKAAYRFLACEQVTPEALGAALREACVARVAEHSVVLAIQDTTTLNYTHHPGTAGRGPLAEPHVLGFLVHSVLAASTQGVPLGVLHQKQWARDPEAEGTRNKRQQRPFADKESFRWVESLQVVHEHIPADTTVINIADREGDIYEVFAELRPGNSELLIRSCYNRCLDKSEKQLHETLEAQPVAGEMNARLRSRPDRKPQDVCLQVRYRRVTLRPPKHRVGGVKLEPVELTAILVTEQRPPERRQPVRWLLLTTLAVESLEDARRIVTYYTYRWLIERFHYTLKSGCRIEHSQLRSVARLRRLLALYCIVAWRLLWMLYLSRAEPNCSCLVALTDQEWRLLYLAWQHLHHRTDPLPETPPPLGEAVRRIAQLGGFIGRKGDGDPGVQTLWRGLTRLQDIVLGATLDNAARHAQDVGNA
jgi:hypothetical protein